MNQRHLHLPVRLLALILPIAIAAVSCGKKQPRIVEPISHSENIDIWPDSIDLHNGVILRAMNDSLLEIRVAGNVLDSVTAGPIRPDRMTYSSAQPLLDMLYRLEASAPTSTRYSAITPYEIFLNPLQTDSAAEVLRSRMKNGIIIPYETRSLGWPAINSNAEWLLAATQLAMVNGDPRWDQTVQRTARSVIDNDLSMSYNPACDLFTGIPRYMAAASGIFPQWMDANDISQIATLSVNVCYAAALSALSPETKPAADADTIVKAINDLLWIPNMGYYSAMAYGIPSTPLPLQVTDNLSQAIAILAGILPDEIARTVVSKTPVTEKGPSLFNPQLPPASAEVKDVIGPMPLRVAWAAACSQAGNEAAYSSAVGALLAMEGERILSERNRLPEFRSTFSTLILRGFCGMRFNPDGIFFVPAVPDGLPGEKHIANLRYRNSLLDIHISGTGRAIATFTIDGHPADPFFPATLEGRHSISITLAGAAAEPGSVNIRPQIEMAPLPPVATWNAERRASLAPGHLPTGLPASALTPRDRKLLTEPAQSSRLLYLNATLDEETTGDTYRLYDARKPVTVQFTTLINSEQSGFSSKPYLYVPPGQRFIIYAPSLAPGGTKILEDKKLAAKFVESNRYKNRNISFEFNAPHAGRYLIDIHYVNGLGVVNAQRKLALRKLRVDRKDAGVFFFPQLRPHAAPRDAADSWQNMAAWSNGLVINLSKGVNTLELRYFQPSPVYADPNSNAILLDMVRIAPIE